MFSLDRHTIENFFAIAINHYEARLSAKKDVFPAWNSVVSRLKADVNEYIKRLENGLLKYESKPAEKLNEICVIDYILYNLKPKKIDYEPELANTKKTIDLRIIIDHTTYYIDIKTIHPINGNQKDKEKWYKDYKNDIKQSRFPENIEYILDEDSSVLYHYRKSSRSKFLSYTLELEDKISEARIESPNEKKIMLFCGDGFCWDKHELNFFAEFYFNGTYSHFDVFSKMEKHTLSIESKRLNRTVDSFAYIFRRSNEVIYKACSLL